jgi:hypothetical protein
MAETRHAIDRRGCCAPRIVKKKLSGILVASPANPDRHDDDARRRSPDLINVGGGRWASALSRMRSIMGSTTRCRRRPRCELSENVLVINSFSKYFCMTGWRVGWIVAPKPLIRSDRPAAAGNLVDLGADAVADRGGCGF